MEFEYLYRFTERAAIDLDEILKYISLDLGNPIAAGNFGKKVFEKIDMIRLFPDSCERVDNEFLTDKSLRKLLVDNYIIYYKPNYIQKIIIIVRIIYGKRNLDDVLKNI
ncbi:MAG: type II toxin-antitoxin system RelE/ParE family toxin [Clostridia bacterium]|nr:type II toxin-antitoxin system RelE/ParE family toxin [Clostridia bacterium]